MSDDRIDRVLIAGGTHGNEWIGAWLVEHWTKYPEKLARSSFQTSTLLANPAALERRQRYIEQDLNRSFGERDVQFGTNLESRRARELLEEFGPKGTRPVDVLLDLHTTTSNMGLSYIVTNRDPFNLRMAAWVKKCEPSLRVYLWIDDTLPDQSLSSIVSRGVAIEVGPTPNNLVRGDLLLGTQRVVQACLDFMEAENRGAPAERTPEPLEVFVHLRSYDYPRDAQGNPRAFIHPELQDRDFQALHPGDPVFLTLDGETIRYASEEPTVYPVFINEAAYYEKGLAFSVTRAQTLLI